MMGGPGPSQGCFQPFRNNYNNNPIGALQERFHREGIIPTYQLINTGGYDHARMFTMQVSLPNGLTAIGTAPSKKAAKHNSARAMLDILDGRASSVSSEVSQSITDGLKALRGDTGSPSPGPKTFKPKVIMNENQMRFLAKQNKQQEELLKQQLQYGPLGVKLWFSGDDKGKDIGGGSVQDEPNRGPPEPAGPTDDQKLEKVQQSDFYIKAPLHEETLEEFIQKIILRSVFEEINKRAALAPSEGDIDRLLKNTKSGGGSADTICKMCNLVFRHPDDCEEHKKTTDHLHVVKGYFPGEGGYHCFLCWISFQQAEGLLNHISRANHQARCKKKGVLRIWMEPVANKSWDLLNVHKHIRDLKTEGKSRRDRRSRSRDRRKSRSRERSSKTRRRESLDSLKRSRSRNDQHDDRSDRKTRRRSSPDKWAHDMYPGGRSRSKSGQFEWREVKVKNEDRLTPRVKDKDRNEKKSSQGPSRELSHGEENRHRSSHHRDTRSREGEVPRSRSGHHSGDKSVLREKSRSSTSTRERSSGSRSTKAKSGVYPLPVDTIQGHGHDHREETSVQYDVNLYGDNEEGSRPSSAKRLSESSETSRRGKRSRRMTGSDHEEVNEIQDDFEIDSVGKIENSEETLQKMKSAIIGILDEEISTLSKKIKK